MKPTILILAAILALGACDQTHNAAITQNDGSTISAERRVAARSDNFTLTSTEGWTCEGTANVGYGNIGIHHTMPLTCSDGATGSAKLTYGATARAAQQQTAVQMEFTLSNGRTGKLIL